MVKKLSKLNKLERFELKKSIFARSRKTLVIGQDFLNKFYRRHRVNGLEALAQKMKIALCLCEYVEINLPNILPNK